MSVLDLVDSLIEDFENAPEPSTDEKAQAAAVEFKGKFGLSHTTVRSILQSPESFFGRDIIMCGWVASQRQMFISLEDGSCVHTFQCVVDLKDSVLGPLTKSLSRGTSVRLEGKCIESAGKGQAAELAVKKITVLGKCDPKKYPLPKMKKGKPLTMEYLRQFQHMRARTNVIRAGQTVRNIACKATHDFFCDRGFQYVHTPLITAADCEGAGEAFTVTTLLEHGMNAADLPKTKDGKVDFGKDFFGRQANLTVSGQLHVETYCLGMGNVYTFGPTFRAENSHTNRHLAEFWMIEPEIAFANFKDVQDLAEDYLKFCLHRFLTKCPDEIKFLGERFGRKDNIGYLKDIVESDFVRLTYTDGVAKLIESIENKEVQIICSSEKFEGAKKEILEAEHVDNECIKMLDRWKDEGKVTLIKDPKALRLENFKVVGNKKMKKKFKKVKAVFENVVFWGVDLSSEHEKYMTQFITKKPTILTDYPKAIKSFYMKANPCGKTVQACDLLVPGVGEVIGGSTREDDLEKLVERVKAIGIDPKEMDWYLDLRRYGSVPHGGFGLGLERLLMLATGIENIRDMIPFPRYPMKCEY